MKDIVIGIDAGTSVIKSIAFDLSGEQLAISSVPNEYHLSDGGYAEQDMAVTWEKTASSLSALAEKVPDLASRTAAIAVTGQGDGTWMTDAHGEPVANALLWLDSRAAGLADQITAKAENRQRFETTGTGINGCQQGAQLLWFKHQQPEVLSRAAKAMHCKDWLYYKLTGEIATDPSEGNFTFGNFRTRQYDQSILEILGLSDYHSLLPQIVEGTEHSAALSETAASICGLPAGCPVVLGYVDVICTALGGGLYAASGSPGCTIIGSTGMHMRLARSADDVVLNNDGTGYTMCMPIPGVYAQMQSNMSATLNIDWLLDTAIDLFDKIGISKTRAELLDPLNDWVAAAQPGSLLYQPYISEAGERGPFIDASARAGFTGLSTRHGFGDLARAVFEGLSFAARDCYTSMGELPAEICISGGAARSTQLMKILASTLGASVRTSSRQEAGAAGAAMMAAVSIGHYSSMDDCVAEWVSPHLGDATEPDTGLAQQYNALYPTYAKTHQALRPVWHALAEIRQDVS